MELVNICKGIILNNSDIVLVRREDSNRYNGYLELPGGKKREYESLEECLIREINEETGINNINKVNQFCSFCFKDYILNLFICEIQKDKIQIKNKNAQWFSIEDLSNLKLTPYTEEILPFVFHVVRNRDLFLTK